MNDLPRLMLVTDRRATGGRDLPAVVRDAVAGGVGLVQVREKDLDDAAFGDLVTALQQELPAGATLLLNGRPALAAKRGLGLHLPAALLDRDLAGVSFFGASVHDEAEAESALARGAHYLVAGTVFPTDSKPGRPPAGPEWIERLGRQAGSTPIYAIGGITALNVAEVMRAGAYGVAVRSGILSASNVKAAADEVAAALLRCC